MAKGKYKCPQCDRTFSMAAHLARHQSTIHAKGGGKAAGGSSGRRPGRPPGSGRASYTGSNNGATQVLGAMQDYYDQLHRRRQEIESELAAVASAMETIGGSTPAAAPAKRGPGRPPSRGPIAGTGRSGSLKEYVVTVLKQSSEPLSPREIAGAVQNSGYPTRAKDLTKAVSNLLPNVERIKRVGFGKYTL